MDPTILKIAANGNIVLLLDVDDVKNTILRLYNDHRPHYIVHTVNHTQTTIYGGDLLLATIKRRVFRPDLITFPGSLPLDLGHWLKAPVFWSFPLSFEEGGKRFEWRENFVGQLSLYDPGRSETVAWFSKSRKRVENGRRVTHSAFIAIKPAYDYMRDKIVMSCLLAEHKLRMKGKNTGLAEGSASIGFTQLGAVLQ